jgi:L-aminopeptidase/D-esterase-like protein
VFDLGTGEVAWPGPDDGHAACLAASDGAPPEGRVGAGTGATVGKLLGPDRSCPGGVGTASVRLPGGAVVGALAVVNAVGDVHGRDGRLLAGARGPGGELAGAWPMLLGTGRPQPPAVGASTTIAVVATDALLDKAGCRRLAEVAHDGLALAVRPAHTPYDGDTIFAVSTGASVADPVSLGVAAAVAMWRAVERAVTGG